MPLNNSLEDKGKCGFKLNQYMGLGIVGVATAITINKEIINYKVNGFLVKEDNSNWLAIFIEAIQKKEHFQKIGLKARNDIMNHYSFKSNQEVYLTFIKRCLDK